MPLKDDGGLTVVAFIFEVDRFKSYFKTRTKCLGYQLNRCRREKSGNNLE